MKIGSSIKNSLSFILFFTISFLFISCNTSEKSEVFSFNGITMGTTYSIKFVVKNTDNKFDEIKGKVDSLLIEINKQMSTYINESELSRFNNFNDTNWFSVSEDLAKVLNDAIYISKETDYFYDITIGPVVNLWGFGPENNSVRIPSDEEIAKAKIKTGVNKLTVDLENSAIKKNRADLYCDLSSIAKGFGVDKVGLLLEEFEIDNYMVEIGGEVRTKGKNDKNEDWKIGISTPLSNGLQKILKASGASLATSGDYLNFFEREGKRFSHLIDPRTGKPITHNLASVTVIDSNCKIADAYATAISIMGQNKGYEFALNKNLPIFMIIRENDKFIEKMTPHFKKYIYEKE